MTSRTSFLLLFGVSLTVASYYHNEDFPKPPGMMPPDPQPFVPTVRSNYQPSHMNFEPPEPKWQYFYEKDPSNADPHEMGKRTGGVGGMNAFPSPSSSSSPSTQDSDRLGGDDPSSTFPVPPNSPLFNPSHGHATGGEGGAAGADSGSIGGAGGSHGGRNGFEGAGETGSAGGADSGSVGGAGGSSEFRGVGRGDGTGAGGAGVAGGADGFDGEGGGGEGDAGDSTGDSMGGAAGAMEAHGNGRGRGGAGRGGGGGGAGEADDDDKDDTAFLGNSDSVGGASSGMGMTAFSMKPAAGHPLGGYTSVDGDLSITTTTPITPPHDGNPMHYGLTDEPLQVNPSTISVESGFASGFTSTLVPSAADLADDDALSNFVSPNGAGRSSNHGTGKSITTSSGPGSGRGSGSGKCCPCCVSGKGRSSTDHYTEDDEIAREIASLPQVSPEEERAIEGAYQEHHKQGGYTYELPTRVTLPPAPTTRDTYHEFSSPSEPYRPAPYRPAPSHPAPSSYQPYRPAPSSYQPTRPAPSNPAPSSYESFRPGVPPPPPPADPVGYSGSSQYTELPRSPVGLPGQQAVYPAQYANPALSSYPAPAAVSSAYPTPTLTAAYASPAPAYPAPSFPLPVQTSQYALPVQAPVAAYPVGGGCGCAPPPPACCTITPCCLPTLPCCPPPPPIPCCPVQPICCAPVPVCCPPPPVCCPQPVIPQCYRACPSCPCRRRRNTRHKRAPYTSGSCMACSAGGQPRMSAMRKKRQLPSPGCQQCSSTTRGKRQAQSPFDLMMGVSRPSSSCSQCSTSQMRSARVKRMGCLPCLGRKRRAAELQDEEPHRRTKRNGCIPCLGRKKRSIITIGGCSPCGNLHQVLHRVKRTISCVPCGRKKRSIDEEASADSMAGIRAHALNGMSDADAEMEDESREIRRAPFSASSPSCACDGRKKRSTLAPAPSTQAPKQTALFAQATRVKRAVNGFKQCDSSCCDYSRCHELTGKRDYTD